MGHNHDHTHEIKGRISMAFFLNLVFTVIELIGGLLFNSFAILSDAIHDLGDSLSLGLAWYFQKVSEKERNRTFTYGFKRFSVLGALINVIVLASGSILIVYHAIDAIIEGRYEPVAEGMLGLSILGIIFNGIAAYRTRLGTSLNERVVSLHLLEDVLGWVAVLITSLIIMLWQIDILDPILSILISVYIFYNAIRNLIKSIKVMLQATPSGINCLEMEIEIEKLDGVKAIKDIHIWSLDGEHNIMTLHLENEDSTNLQSQIEIKEKVRTLAREKGVGHVTIEFEEKGENIILEH